MALVSCLVLLILLIPTLEASGQRGTVAGGSGDALRAADPCGKSGSQLTKSDDPFGTPSGSALNCTGAPLRPCSSNQYSEW
jgi:hypothetical protein